MADTTTALPWHLRGNWAPLPDDRTETQLEVEGAIPPELNGTYIRTGPNPKSGTSAHWFLGDGMVHGIRLRQGKAEWYRNRFVQTPNITEPEGRGKRGDLRRGTGNTHVLVHGQEILCLNESAWPWRIDQDLNTLGVQNYGGALTSSMTAHPKVCPETGELLAFSYFSFTPPYLHYIRVGADGQLKQLEGIDVPNMVMMHDFAITRNYVIFLDLPLVFKPELLASGMPFKFDPSAGARIGVMPRNGSNRDVRWLTIDPCYVFHTVNAYEQGGRIVMHVSKMASAFGANSNDFSNVARLWRWTIDLSSGVVKQEQLDDMPGDFGRVNDSRVGLEARYGYLMSLAGEGDAEEPVYGPQLLKYDLRSGARVTHELGANVRGGEPVFVPGGTGEDEGWVMVICHDEARGRSKFLILDARDFSAKPVAVIHLPRVPYGAHGSWVPFQE
ncbi:MAG: carotenoid oxygenase family protein [Hyphomonas sp.]|jgi:carotenoid cleavage dioxygenase